MALRFYRNGPARALAAPLANATDTTITLDNVSGFPSQFPYTLIIDPDLVTEEVVDVTNVVGNIATIVRGVDSTTAIAHATGAKVYHGVTARDATEANTHVNSSTNVHGGTGTVVDTGSVQTITASKNFTGGLNSGGQPVVDIGTTQTINGAKTFAANIIAQAGLTISGTSTTAGPTTFNGATTFNVAETHTNTEAHSGTETHTGPVSFTNAVNQWVNAVDTTNTESNSTTTYLPGTNPTGVVFTAPPSGRVMVTITSYFGQTTNTNEAIVSWALRTGGTIGSGTVVLGPSGQRALVCGMAVNASAPARLQASRRSAITGLTPGSVYNVRIEFATSPAGGCAIFTREIIVEPT